MTAVIALLVIWAVIATSVALVLGAAIHRRDAQRPTGRRS